MSFFLDAGTDGIFNTSALQLNQSGVTNIEQTFPGTALSRKLPIYPGTNFKLRDSAGIEFGLNIPIIQAPFRIYYAYNLNRFHSQIIAPNLIVNQNTIDTWEKELGPQIWNGEIVPQLIFLNNPGRLNYFEPKTTFRFTVGKTF
jgi:outer membrane protein insertion porin family